MVDLTVEQKQQIDKIRCVMQDRTKLEHYIEGYKERRYLNMTNASEQEKEAKETYLKAYLYCQQCPDNDTLIKKTELLKSKLERARNSGRKRGYLTNRASVYSSYNIYKGMTLNIRTEDIAKARQALPYENEVSLLDAIDKAIQILNIYERKERKGLSKEERQAVINKRQPQKRR